MPQHPYRYSVDPMLNSGLVPGRDLEEEKATSDAEKDAPYRIPVKRPVVPIEDHSDQVVPHSPAESTRRAPGQPGIDGDGRSGSGGRS